MVFCTQFRTASNANEIVNGKFGVSLEDDSRSNEVKEIFFLKKKIWRTWVFFVGPLIPLFWTSGDVSSGFQCQSGQPYSSLVEVYMLHTPWDSITSGATPADLVVASMAAELSLPHTCETLVGLETGSYHATAQCEIRQTLKEIFMTLLT